MKYEYKRMLCEDWNFEITPGAVAEVLYGRGPLRVILWDREIWYTARNKYIRGISNEERREYHFSDRFFNNVPIDKDRDRL